MGAKEAQGQKDPLLPYSYGQFWDPAVCPGQCHPVLAAPFTLRYLIWAWQALGEKVINYYRVLRFAEARMETRDGGCIVPVLYDGRSLSWQKGVLVGMRKT